jgi:hypothetical protein
MAATNALLAFGGMIQHCRRRGWRMFFCARPIVESLARSTIWSSTTFFSNSRNVQRARPLGGLEQASAISLASFSPSKIRATAGCRPLLAAQHSLEAFFHQLLPDPVNHRCAGLQRPDNPVVPPCVATPTPAMALEQARTSRNAWSLALCDPATRVRPLTVAR